MTRPSYYYYGTYAGSKMQRSPVIPNRPLISFGNDTSTGTSTDNNTSSNNNISLYDAKKRDKEWKRVGERVLLSCAAATRTNSYKTASNRLKNWLLKVLLVMNHSA